MKQAFLLELKHFGRIRAGSLAPGLEHPVQEVLRAEHGKIWTDAAVTCDAL